MSKKNKQAKKTSIPEKILCFFFPKNFKGELARGMEIGAGSGIAKGLWHLSFGFGKLLRKIVDPQHKMKFEKKPKEGK